MATNKELSEQIESLTEQIKALTIERDNAIKASNEKATGKVRAVCLKFSKGDDENDRSRAIKMVLGPVSALPTGYVPFPSSFGLEGGYFPKLKYGAAAEKEILADLPDAISDDDFEAMARAEMERKIAERLAERIKARAGK